ATRGRDARPTDDACGDRVPFDSSLYLHPLGDLEGDVGVIRNDLVGSIGHAETMDLSPDRDYDRARVGSERVAGNDVLRHTAFARIARHARGEHALVAGLEIAQAELGPRVVPARIGEELPIARELRPEARTRSRSQL